MTGGRLHAPIAAALLLAGCFSPRPESEVEVEVRRLSSEDAAERDAAFAALLRADPWMLPAMRRSAGAAPRRGFPVVAVLTVLGEGHAVPLDLRARHLASFRWPASQSEENAVVEPFAWHRIERQAVEAGAPALRFLAEGIARDASDEAGALRAARAMMRIGGRAAAEAFAGLLVEERGLGGVRVCDVAAAALLVSGWQELPLRLADPEARRKAALEWWAHAKDQAAADWLRESALELAARWAPKDPEGVKPVLELLAGKAIADPAEWRAKSGDWRPATGALRPAELLPALAAGRPEAFEANRRLEEATGWSVAAPRMDRLGELCAALRLWRPEPDLALRWRRRLESPLLRVSIAMVGHHPPRGRNQVLFAGEAQHPAVEEDRAEVRFATSRGTYRFHVQSRELGTRLAVSEYVTLAEGTAGFTSEHSGARPLPFFSESMQSCVLVWVDELPARQGPRTQDQLFAQARSRVRAAVPEAEGEERRRLLRALGYFQEKGDAELLREQRSGEGLLLLGDPAGLEFAPALEPWEVEMALRRAEDAKLRSHLEGLRNPK